MSDLSASCSGIYMNAIETGPGPFDRKFNALHEKISLVQNEFGDLEISSKKHPPCNKKVSYFEHVN